MARRYFIRLSYFLIIIFICISGGVCYSASIDSVLYDNEYIELENKEKQIVKLNIKRDGLYTLKSLGLNDVIIDLFNEGNEKVYPNYVECDGNIFATYMLNSGVSYCANIKMKLRDENEKSKLRLYFLDDSVLVDEKGINGCIDNYNEDKYFKYVPWDNDLYMIKSSGNIDLNASIYDDKGANIQDSSDITGLNFKIFEKLKKGKCYYIRVWSIDDVGNFKLDILKKQLRNKDVIDLYMCDRVDSNFCGYAKKGDNDIKFVSDVDGEYKFVLTSEMNLCIDIKDEEQKSIAKYCECNKNYSFAMADIKKGKEYIIRISNDLDKFGAYKLKILNFCKIMSCSKDIVIGKNEGFISKEDEYLRFVCPSDGVFSFKNLGEEFITIDFYDENGKLLKESKSSLGVLRQIFGIKSNKGDVLYLKIRDRYGKLLKFNYEIDINNFCDSIKDCYSASVGETSGYIEDLSKVCMYKFVPRRGGTYFIKSRCDRFIGCRLYNSEGYLMQEDCMNFNFIIASKLEKGEEYYIEISSMCSVGEFCFEIMLLDDIQKIKIQEDVWISNKIEYLGEVKQYEFCASKDAIYLPIVESLVDIDIVKRDENGNVVENMNLKKGEKRIIEISGRNSLEDIGNYSLKIENFTNKIRNAKQVICDKEYQGSIFVPSMQDSYSFVPEVSGHYSICAISDMKMKSRVYDLEGNLLVENKREDDPNFCIVAKLKKGEKYLITINEETGKDACIYALVIEQNKKTKANPEWIKLDKIKFGLLGCDGQEKVYKIVIPKIGKYFIDNYLSFKLDIEVSDENGNVVERIDNEDIPNRGLYEFNENSLYYIRIKAKNDMETGMYGLRIENLDKAYKSAKLLLKNNYFEISKTNTGECSYYKLIINYEDIYSISKIDGDRLYIDLLDRNGNVLYGDFLNITESIKLDKGEYYLRCFSNMDSGIIVLSSIFVATSYNNKL